MRLIDADALIRDLNEYVRNAYGANSIDSDDVADFQRASNSQSEIFTVEGLYEATEIIDKQATIEAEPVRHSKWIGFPNNGVWDLKCDNCHRIIPRGQTAETMHYCPQCGAKMDGGGHNATQSEKQ